MTRSMMTSIKCDICHCIYCWAKLGSIIPFSPFDCVIFVIPSWFSPLQYVLVFISLMAILSWLCMYQEKIRVCLRFQTTVIPFNGCGNMITFNTIYIFLLQENFDVEFSWENNDFISRSSGMIPLKRVFVYETILYCLIIEQLSECDWTSQLRTWQVC